MNIFKNLILTLLLIHLLVSSCSYEKMNAINQKKFYIQEFEVKGEAKESFIIQKKFKGFQIKVVKIELRL